MISDDLEQVLHTLFQNTCIFSSLPRNVYEDKAKLSVAKVWHRHFSFWQYIRFMRMFTEVSGEGHQTNGVIQNRHFKCFRLLYLWNLQK